MSNQFSLYGIHVHVVKFLDELGLTPDVEIVEAQLPELGQQAARVRKRKGKLLRGEFFAGLAAELPRDALFQDLQDEGRSALDWLADEQVNVIRHDDVTSQGKTVAVTHFSENLDKQIPGTSGRQKGQAPVATAGDEMPMTQAVATM